MAHDGHIRAERAAKTRSPLFILLAALVVLAVLWLGVAEASRLYSEHRNRYVRGAEQLAAQGDVAGAARLLGLHVESFPEDRLRRLRLAELLLDSGDIQAAKQLIDRFFADAERMPGSRVLTDYASALRARSVAAAQPSVIDRAVVADRAAGDIQEAALRARRDEEIDAPARGSRSPTAAADEMFERWLREDLSPDDMARAAARSGGSKQYRDRLIKNLEEFADESLALNRIAEAERALFAGRAVRGQGGASRGSSQSNTRAGTPTGTTSAGGSDYQSMPDSDSQRSKSDQAIREEYSRMHASGREALSNGDPAGAALAFMQAAAAASGQFNSAGQPLPPFSLWDAVDAYERAGDFGAAYGTAQIIVDQYPDFRPEVVQPKLTILDDKLP